MITMNSRYSLLRRIVRSKKLIRKIKISAPLQDEHMLVYEEKSSTNDIEKSMDGGDLFNLFTADIIKKHKVFVR
jgi:hypothetical protein